MIKVSDLLDLNKLGKMELVEVRPTYAYVDEKRTDTISGYSYCVVLTDHNYEKIYVRILGAQQVEIRARQSECTLRGCRPVYMYMAIGRDWHLRH